MNRFLRILATFILVTVVTGCGQSGKLYVPGNPSELTTTPSTRQGGGQDTDTTEAKKKEDTKEKSEQK